MSSVEKVTDLYGNVLTKEELQKLLDENGEPNGHERFLNKDGSLNHEKIWASWRAKQLAASTPIRGGK